MKALLPFARLLLGQRMALLVSLGLSLVTVAAGIGLLGVSGWFLTATAITTAGAAFNLFAPSAAVRGLSFVRILARYGEKTQGHDATLRLLSQLRVWLFARLFPLVPLRKGVRRGDLVSRLVSDIDALDTLFLVALGPMVTAILAGSGVTLVLAFLLPGAAPVFAAAFFLAIVAVPAGLLVASRRAAASASQASSQLRQAVLDGIDGQRDIIAFGATGHWSARLDTLGKQLAEERRKLGTRAAIAGGAVQALCAAALLGSLLVGLDAFSAGRIEGPLLVGLLLAIVASFEACAMLVRSTARLSAAAAAAGRLNRLVASPPAVEEPANPRELPSGGAVAFRNVEFGYDAALPILRGVSFAVAAGECVCIAGPSGAGKSTIALLLAGLARPEKGSVEINGCDLAQASSRSIQRAVALMTQDAPVFLDTVRANLLIGNNAASDTELWRMLSQVHLADFVRSLPQGLDTVVGEAGRTLSAGQARRLCLARTLLRDAAIVVLDEPTSGLDAETEDAFLASLPALLRGRTGIVISHARIPDDFDRVLTLRAGRLEG